MTLAEQLENRGLQKGLKQGLEQGLLEGIELAVNIKFGDTDDCRTLVTKIKSVQNINRLKSLKEKILSAATLPELIRFIDK